MTRADRDGRLPPRTTLVLGTLALLVAAAHGWTSRYRVINLDGVSYLDVADAWRTAGWHDAVNGYWSPLYSWVLAAAMATMKPRPAMEYVLVHAVNLVLFALSFAACALFVRELLRDAAHDAPGPRLITWSPAQLTTLALVLWTWIALTQLVIAMESADLLVAIATFVAAAMMVRLRRSIRLGDGFTLGVALGAGYLAKAAMLPLSAIYLLAAFAIARRRWMQLPLAIAGLAIVAAPWMAALSVVKGHPTMGDAGKLNYIWFVGHAKDYPHLWPRYWPHPDGLGSAGTATHPDGVLLETPAVYDLSTHGGYAATYSPWYDPSRLYDGLRAAPTVRDQLRRLRISADDVFSLLTVNAYRLEWMNPQLPLVAVVLACWLAAAPGRRWRVHWALIVPAAATVALYALVYVSPRYLGAAMCVMWIALIAGVRLPDQKESPRLLHAAAVVGTAVVAFAIVSATLLECGPGWRRLLRGEADEENIAWHIAEVVHGAGIGEGARVAIVGNGQVATRWARLARVKIVAEVPIADLALFAASPDAAAGVVRALERSTARFVLAEKIPAGMTGWRPLEGTPYWFREINGI